MITREEILSIEEYCAEHKKMSHKKRQEESEFEKYRVIQDKLFSSDFDRFSNDGLLPLDITPEN